MFSSRKFISVSHDVKKLFYVNFIDDKSNNQTCYYHIQYITIRNENAVVECSSFNHKIQDT